MTSPSAAHTGHIDPDPFAVRALASTPELAAADLVMGAETLATLLVDSGHASWCPTCAGKGTLPALKLVGGLITTTPTLTRTTCTRCRGGRLNPFHGCTFTAETPCTCTTSCQVYQPQETPTP